MQNTSHAVMSQRVESSDSPDNFPTPPWATRALLEHVLGGKSKLSEQSVLEPACGGGYMVRVLKEYFGQTYYSDAFDDTCGPCRDFLFPPYETDKFDWVITNPPFRLAEEFIARALGTSRVGVAMLARTVFLEGVGRHTRLFSLTPPTKFVQFTERVPMVKGRVDPKASTATSYAWFVWEKYVQKKSQLVWIPPCRKVLERAGDYDSPIRSERA